MSLKCILTGKNEDLDAKLAKKVDTSTFESNNDLWSSRYQALNGEIGDHINNIHNPHGTGFSTLVDAGGKTNVGLNPDNWTQKTTGSSEYVWEISVQITDSNVLGAESYVWVTPHIHYVDSTVDFTENLQEWTRCSIIAYDQGGGKLYFAAKKKPTKLVYVDVVYCA